MTLRAALLAFLVCEVHFEVPALEVYTKTAVTDAIAGKAEIKDLAGSIYYWATAKERILTYWIDRESFRSPGEAEWVDNALQAAARDWIEACPEAGIRIERSPEASQAIFRIIRSRRNIPAESFFPDYPPRKRRLIIGDMFFAATAKYDPVGILRHELGHILGYRHEHLRTSKERQRECQWMPDPRGRHALSFTPYDPDSVMHYPCSKAKEKWYFRLSPLDIEAHRNLYGP